MTSYNVYIQPFPPTVTLTDLTVTGDVNIPDGSLSDSKLLQITTANKVADSANTSLTDATDAATPSKLAKRNASGDVSFARTNTTDLRVSSITPAVNSTTGSICTNGGLWVGRNAKIVQNFEVGGTATFSDTTEVSSYVNAGAMFAGGVGITKSLKVGGSALIPSVFEKDLQVQGNLDCSLDVSGNVITALDGIYVPSSGGTATKWTSLEETTQALTFTGIWGSNQSQTIGIFRDQSRVTLTFYQLSATGTTAATITTTGNTIPSRFRPTNTVREPFVVKDNGNETDGLLQVNTDGTLQIGASRSMGNFSGTGASGWTNQRSITYTVT